MDFSAALPTFVVTLREGFEASLVVGIVLACLKKVEQTQLNRWVYQGIGGGIVASVLVGFLLGGILQGVNTYQSPYTPIIKECLATLFGIIAVAMLSWMLIWMTQQGKQLKGEVEQGIEAALTGENGAEKGIFLLVFIAVLREGFETVLFIIAKFENSWKIPSIGATLGLLTAVILGFLLFKLGVKINIRLFFKVMGVFLLLVVGGLVLGVLKHLNLVVMFLAQLEPSFSQWCWVPGDSCILGPLVWDGSEILPDKTFPGIILKSLFGYRQTLYLGQIVVYLLFLLIVGSFYFKSLSSSTPSKSAENVS
ncbi:putative Iron permease FTR1 [Crocosphaera subtropica ATCC 51142]|uniref:Iron permease FTR1 n=1 Tax=Crocosphaera subtropica (strain ATCC 51142 / BH68) TaxID=43989 RepID=B1WTS0_CROS5|nr:FTR1 family protein [Crocosphaera subtropica]ACB50386.1 putative Iron permease FTR1 [Crocosphaera subtropica ATCC 51142]